MATANKTITNREEVFLVEFIPGMDGHLEAPVVKEDSGMVDTYHGLKIKRIVDGNCEILSDFDPSSECCDMECLRDKQGSFIVSAAAPDNNHEGFHWVVWEIDAMNEDGTQLVFKRNIREADDNEIKLLNEIFPEYIDNCYVDETERMK